MDKKITWLNKQVHLHEIKDYLDNPRKIKTNQLQKLSNHIKEDGYHQRILLNADMTIIGGHQRKKALFMAGFKQDDLIDVIVSDRELTKEELDRINVRDNLQFGEYDFDILISKFDQETLLNFGFNNDDIKRLFISDDIFNEDQDIGDIEPKSKHGDLYQLGDHRLLCGDSTKKDDVNKLLQDASPILMVTDPPYGVIYYTYHKKLFQQMTY